MTPTRALCPKAAFLRALHRECTESRLLTSVPFQVSCLAGTLTDTQSVASGRARPPRSLTVETKHAPQPLRLATLAAPQHRPNAIVAYFREGRARSTYGSIAVVGTSRDRNPKAANFACTAGGAHRHGTALPAETCARMLADVASTRRSWVDCQITSSSNGGRT